MIIKMEDLRGALLFDGQRNTHTAHTGPPQKCFLAFEGSWHDPPWFGGSGKFHYRQMSDLQLRCNKGPWLAFKPWWHLKLDRYLPPSKWSLLTGLTGNLPARVPRGTSWNAAVCFQSCHWERILDEEEADKLRSWFTCWPPLKASPSVMSFDPSWPQLVLHFTFYFVCLFVMCISCMNSWTIPVLNWFEYSLKQSR